LANRPPGESDTVIVIGLGRFGSAVADSLLRLGHEVYAIDTDAGIVQRWSDRLTHVVQADATDSDVLRQLGCAHFRHAVVGIGSDVEGSVLTVLALAELGIPDIWAKATSTKHGCILERTGAHHVVYPEASMGERVAHMVTGKMIEFIAFEDGFAIAKTCAPQMVVGKTLTESGLRTRYGVTVVGVKRGKTDFVHALPDTRVEPGDLLVVSGPTQAVEAFAALT